MALISKYIYENYSFVQQIGSGGIEKPHPWAWPPRSPQSGGDKSRHLWDQGWARRMDQDIEAEVLKDAYEFTKGSSGSKCKSKEGKENKAYSRNHV